MVGKRAFANEANDEANGSTKADLESGLRRRGRFKDAVDQAMTERTTLQLKKELRDGVVIEDFLKFRRSDDEIKSMSNKKLRSYYEDQNERLDQWLEVDTVVEAIADEIMDSMNPDHDHDGINDHEGGLQGVQERIEDLLPQDLQDQRRRDQRIARWAININVLANIILLVAKAIAIASSDSLSLLASLLDSALDLLCTVIIWTTNRLVSWRLRSLRARFPVGRRRLEPVGILVFSVIMVLSFAQVLQESVKRLLPGGDRSVAALGPVAVGSMVGTIVLKGIIGLGCYRIKTTQVQALVQDCKTDVYFNTLSLLFPLIGAQTGAWWLDPAGATLLSLYIIYDWAGTALENVVRLCGIAADEKVHMKLTFLAFRFSPLVLGFKCITAYHAGDGVWVEYDILLAEKTPLHRAHDIAETLQYCAEALPEIDRCFVSCDYSAQNPGGHSTDHA